MRLNHGAAFETAVPWGRLLTLGQIQSTTCFVNKFYWNMTTQLYFFLIFE